MAVTYQLRFVICDKCSTAMRDVRNKTKQSRKTGKRVGGEGEGLYGDSLYFPFYFFGKLKRLKNKVH